MTTASTSPIRIGVSSCLLGEEARWSGCHVRQSFLVDTIGHSGCDGNPQSRSEGSRHPLHHLARDNVPGCHQARVEPCITASSMGSKGASRLSR